MKDGEHFVFDFAYDQVGGKTQREIAEQPGPREREKGEQQRMGAFLLYLMVDSWPWAPWHGPSGAYIRVWT